MNHDTFEHHFDLSPDLIYLNHAAVSPWPRVTADAVWQFTEQNATCGAQYYPQWIDIEQQLRQRLQRLLNAADTADIGLLKNTSEGLSFIAHGLDWRAGDNIVTSDQEFPSNRMPWQMLASRDVELREIDIGATDSPESALLAACDGQTRVLTISSVQYASGLCMDLTRLGEFCHANGIVFVVDAIQSLGALPIDVRASHIDYLVADAHKWLLGPEGIAVFYAHADARDALEISEFGWHMREDYLNFDARDWQVAASCRRFECGSPNMLGIHALHASVGLLLDTGIDVIAGAIRGKAEYLFEQIGHSAPLHLTTDTRAGRYAGIVSFTIDGQDATPIYTGLMQQGVICALRNGAIRFSPHFYTTTEKLDAGLERCLAIIGRE